MLQIITFFSTTKLRSECISSCFWHHTFCLPTCATRDRFDPCKTFYLGRCSVILPQLTDIFLFPSSSSVCFLLSVSVSPASLSVPLRSSLSRPGPLDKVSVCVYLRAPSFAHYHENGLSPALILCVSVVINVFIQTLHGGGSSGGRGWEDTAPAKKKTPFPRKMRSNMSPCVDSEIAASVSGTSQTGVWKLRISRFHVPHGAWYYKCRPKILCNTNRWCVSTWYRCQVEDKPPCAVILLSSRAHY